MGILVGFRRRVGCVGVGVVGVSVVGGGAVRRVRRLGCLLLRIRYGR
jgi:hypothetical protein